MKTILIISNTQDYHVDKVLDILNKNHTNYFVLNLDQFPQQYLLNQTSCNTNFSSTLENTDTKQRVSLSNIGAIWLRKPADFSYKQIDMERATLQFANQETEHALFSALYSLDCFWISHPKDLRASMWKGEQLKRASKLGFNIPDTLISNDPEKIRAFYLKHKKVIYKVMSDPVINGDNLPSQGVATTLIDEQMLEDTDSLRLLPNQFQAYIEKAYELRVTIIAGKIFTAKLDSQLHPETQIDCRNLNIQIPMSSYELPEKVALACLAFVNSYGLNYSALDFIVTPESDYVFLENNPNGQFMFIEENVPELEITHTLVETLEKACRQHA
ncbi:MvdC/MvdD family ATP grasp protein [Pseudoalteromonas ulvae]|uniref:MvdD-like pre-ATP grasp domain-containing protein n=1 Tax=Pseudoalteromonas ulvae TaxID=107327 RepID=A0A244CLT7_PSEDV|nr:hypothetical protein [Pseudoalteromonas ulvae]OUL56508.1 hypothetical protein B1199_17755 [Pseudoalteromonas ulvae]